MYSHDLMGIMTHPLFKMRPMVSELILCTINQINNFQLQDPCKSTFHSPNFIKLTFYPSAMALNQQCIHILFVENKNILHLLAIESCLVFSYSNSKSKEDDEQPNWYSPCFTSCVVFFHGIIDFLLHIDLQLITVKIALWQAEVVYVK